jgi:hypothetical protein
MEDVGIDATAPCECKLGRVAAAYGFQTIHDDLRRRWEAGEVSVRDLAGEFNRRVLRVAVEDAGRTFLDGEVANLYRLLTAEDVDAGSRTQARERLRQAGVPIDEVEESFVSHQTVYRHLVDCLDASQETSHPDADDRVDAWRDRLQSLQARTTRVTGRGIDQLRNAGALDVGPVDVYVEVTVTCESCGRFYTLDELLTERACDCGSDGEDGSV